MKGEHSEGAWVIVRQDDHGNRFVVQHVATEGAAKEAVDALERGGHKQTYWYERAVGATALFVVTGIVAIPSRRIGAIAGRAIEGTPRPGMTVPALQEYGVGGKFRISSVELVVATDGNQMGLTFELPAPAVFERLRATVAEGTTILLQG
jgi:hypothetical protein